MEISAVVDQVPDGDLERLAVAAEKAAVPDADRDELDDLVDDWCLGLDDDTDEVVLATIIALGARAILGARLEARSAQAAA